MRYFPFIIRVLQIFILGFITYFLFVPSQNTNLTNLIKTVKYCMLQTKYFLKIHPNAKQGHHYNSECV